MVQLLEHALAASKRRHPNLILHCGASAVQTRSSGFARKLTRYINRDLPQLVGRAVGMLHDKWNQQDRRITAYKDHSLNDSAAHDLIIRSVDVGVCANSYIPDVLNQWREPKHEAFEAHNVWSLFNAFTETLKQASLSELPKRTLALHGLLNVAVGLN